MSGRWFRLYDDAVHDPKVQALPAWVFKLWINLLCIASKNDGEVPAIDGLRVVLPWRTDRLRMGMELLKKRGLIDTIEGRTEPHNWRTRQYKSDTSAERTKRYRERRSDVTVTPPDTDTDTERVRKLNNDIIKLPNSCATSPFSIKPGLPEWDAWEQYLLHHKNRKSQPFVLAMQRVLDGKQKSMTVPAKLPEEIDKGYAAALELKRKLDEKAS